MQKVNETKNRIVWSQKFNTFLEIQILKPSENTTNTPED